MRNAFGQFTSSRRRLHRVCQGGFLSEAVRTVGTYGKGGSVAFSRVQHHVACVMVCAGVLLASARPVRAQSAVPADGAFFRGKLVRFTPASARRDRRLVVGNAVLGAIQADHRPNDHRPNLYIVAPGTQFSGGSGDEAVAFNLVLNTLPLKEEAVNWDVYWAIVLDPALRTNITSERELLLATQNAFVPGELFDFDEVPGAAVLREYLQVDSLAGMARFRRADRTLPRVVIVPARFVIRAAAVDPDSSPAPSRISRALSHLSTRKSPTPIANVKK